MTKTTKTLVLGLLTLVMVGGALAQYSSSPSGSWNVGVDSYAYDVAVANGNVFVTETFSGDTLTAVDISSQSESWSVSLDGDPKGVTVSDGTAFVTEANAGFSLTAVDISSQSESWSVSLDGRGYDVAVANGTAFVAEGVEDNRLTAVDISSQSETWSVSLNGKGRSVAAADGNVFVTDGSDTLTAVDISSQSKIWTDSLNGEAQGIVVDGSIFAANGNNGLTAFTFNKPPKFNSSQISPDPPLIGANASYSAEVFDSDGSIDRTRLEVVNPNGTTVFNQTRTGTSPSFSNAFIPQTDGFYNATLTTFDNNGASASAELDRKLVDTAPVVNVLGPSGDLFDYDAGIRVEVQSDGDSRPNEDLSCTTSLDGSQIDSRTVTEGTTFVVDARADLGSHTASTTCAEQDDQQQDTGNTSFTTKAFEFNTISGDNQAFETSTETFEANIRHGDMVNNVEYTFNWNQSTQSFSETYTGIGDSLESTQFTVPLARSDQTNIQYDFTADVNLSDINTGTETLQKTSNSKSQTVNFAYENVTVNARNNQKIEDTPLSLDLSFDNALNTEPATFTPTTTFDGNTKTGFSSTFTAPLVSQANKTFTASGNLGIEFQGRNVDRAAATDQVKVFRKILTDCSTNSLGVSGVQTQTLKLLQEQNRSTSVNGEIDFNYDISVDQSPHTRNYAFNFSGVSQETICLYPDFAEYNAEGPIVYDATGFTQRQFPVDQLTLTDSKTTQPLYLLDEQDSTETIVSVEDGGGADINSLVKVLRYLPGQNNFVEVARTRTGSNGEGQTTLKDGAFYKFVVQQDGEIIAEREQEQFNANSIPALIEITVGSSLPDFLENSDGFEFQLERIRENGNLTGLRATVNHEDSAIQNASLNVDKGAIVGTEPVCRKTVQTSASDLICEFNGTAEGEKFEFTLKSFLDGEEFILQTGSIDKTKGLFGVNQAFAGFLVFMSLSAFGLATPRLAIMLSTAGVIAAATLGLISVGVGALAGLVAVAAIVIMSGERT